MTTTWDEVLGEHGNYEFKADRQGGVFRTVGRPRFREQDHPRDRQGRFIETGSEVRLSGGALATVVGKGEGDRIIVRRNDDGREYPVDRGNLTVTKRPDGSSPTDKPEDAPEALVATPAAPATATAVPDSAAPAAPPAPTADAPITPRMLMDAEDVIGPERVDEITGGAGLSGASPDEVAQILAEAEETRGGRDAAVASDAPSNIGNGHVLDEPSTPTLITNVEVGQVLGQLVPDGGRRYFEVTQRYNRRTGTYGRRELGVEGAADEQVPVQGTAMVTVMDNGVPEGGGGGRPTVEGRPAPSPEDQYVAAAARAQSATSMADAGAAEREAAAIARRHKLDVIALGDRVMARVYADMTDDEVNAALRDPASRGLARAELARRAGGDSTAAPDPAPATTPDPAWSSTAGRESRRQGLIEAASRAVVTDGRVEVEGAHIGDVENLQGSWTATRETGSQHPELFGSRTEAVGALVQWYEANPTGQVTHTPNGQWQMRRNSTRTGGFDVLDVDGNVVQNYPSQTDAESRVRQENNAIETARLRELQRQRDAEAAAREAAKPVGEWVRDPATNQWSMKVPEGTLSTSIHSAGSVTVTLRSPDGAVLATSVAEAGDPAKAEGERMLAYLRTEHPANLTFSTEDEVRAYYADGAPHSLRRLSQAGLDAISADPSMRLVPGTDGGLAVRGKGNSAVLFHVRSGMAISLGKVPPGRKNVDRAAAELAQELPDVQWGADFRDLTAASGQQIVRSLASIGEAMRSGRARTVTPAPAPDPDPTPPARTPSSELVEELPGGYRWTRDTSSTGFTMNVITDPNGVEVVRGGDVESWVERLRRRNGRAINSTFRPPANVTNPTAYGRPDEQGRIIGQGDRELHGYLVRDQSNRTYLLADPRMDVEADGSSYPALNTGNLYRFDTGSQTWQLHDGSRPRSLFVVMDDPGDDDPVDDGLYTDEDLAKLGNLVKPWTSPNGAVTRHYVNNWHNLVPGLKVTRGRFRGAANSYTINGNPMGREANESLSRARLWFENGQLQMGSALRDYFGPALINEMHARMGRTERIDANNQRTTAGQAGISSIPDAAIVAAGDTPELTDAIAAYIDPRTPGTESADAWRQLDSARATGNPGPLERATVLGALPRVRRGRSFTRDLTNAERELARLTANDPTHPIVARRNGDPVTVSGTETTGLTASYTGRIDSVMALRNGGMRVAMTYRDSYDLPRSTVIDIDGEAPSVTPVDDTGTTPAPTPDATAPAAGGLGARHREERTTTWALAQQEAMLRWRESHDGREPENDAEDQEFDRLAESLIDNGEIDVDNTELADQGDLPDRTTARTPDPAPAPDPEPSPVPTAGPDPDGDEPTSELLANIDSEIAAVEAMLARGNGGDPDGPVARRLARLREQRAAEVERLRNGGGDRGPTVVVRSITDPEVEAAPGGYRVGSEAEVLRYDFDTAARTGGTLMTAPEVWLRGTVEKITRSERGFFTVTVRDANGTPHVEVVGPRGGNQRIRAVTAPDPDPAPVNPLDAQSAEMRARYGFGPEWSLGGPAAAIMTTRASNLRPGNVIYTHTDGETINLPSSRNVMQTYARTPRTVTRVEQVPGGIVVHFTDGRSTTTPEQAQRFGRVETGRGLVYGVPADQRGDGMVPDGDGDGGQAPAATSTPEPTAPDTFADPDALGAHLAGWLGLSADNGPRLARLFDGRGRPEFRTVAAIERRLTPDQRERFEHLQVTLRAAVRGEGGQFDGARAAAALKRLDAGDTTLPILAQGQHVRIRVLAENVPQPVIPTDRNPLIYREVAGLVDEVKVYGGNQVMVVVVPDDPNDGRLLLDGTRTPRLTQTVPGDARLSLTDTEATTNTGGTALPDPVVDLPAPAPRLPDRQPTLGRKRAGELVVGDRINLDGDPVTITDTRLDGTDRVLTYSVDASPEDVGRITTDDDDTFELVQGGTTPVAPLPVEPDADEVETDTPITAGGLGTGDQFRRGGALATVVEVTDTDDPDVVDVTATIGGLRTVLPMGRDGVVDRVRAADLPTPERHASDIDAVRPAMYSYQRRRLVALGLDLDDDRTVAEAAQRIRTRQALSADEARALATRLRAIAEDQPHVPQQRALRRIADQLDAASIASGSRTASGRFEPGAKPRRGTVADLTEGDEVAFVDLAGQTVSGNLTGLRSKMSGRLYEVEVTGAGGEVTRHLLNRDSGVFRLGDLPEPEVLPTPAPARVQRVREHIGHDRLGVGDVVLRTMPGGITGEFEVMELQRRDNGNVTADLRLTTATSLPTENILYSEATDGGPTIIRVARGEESAAQPWDATLADDDPTEVMGGDLSIGDRIEQTDLLGVRRAGMVVDLEAMRVDDDDADGVGNPVAMLVSVRHDNGVENTYVIGEGQSVTRLVAADADAASRIAAARVERARIEKVNHARALLAESVVSDRGTLLGRTRLNLLRNPNAQQLLAVIADIAPPPVHAQRAQRILQGVTRNPNAGVDTRGQRTVDRSDANLAAVQEVLRQQFESDKRALADSISEAVASPLPGETERQAMTRVLQQWEDNPPAPRNAGAIARGLVEGWERVESTDAGSADTAVPRVPELPEGANLTDRMRAYRNALPEQGSVGRVPTRRVTYGRLDIDALERGEVPDVVITTAGEIDLHRGDKGPGEHAMAHLDVIMAAGRDLRLSLDERIKAKERELGVDEVDDGPSLADLMHDKDMAALRLQKHEDQIKREVAEEFGFRAWSHLMLVRNGYDSVGATPEQTAQAERARDAVKRNIERQSELADDQRALLDTISAYNAKARAINAGNVGEATKRRGEARRLAALELLAEVRPDGLGGHKLDYVSNETRTKGRPLKDNHALVKAARYAEKHYPTNWLRALAESRNGEAIKLKSVTRGSYGAKEMNLSKRAAANLSDTTERGGVTIHELGHGMEETLPDLVAAERAFLWSRTSTGEIGSRTREARTQIAGDKATSKGYKDEFAKHYTGRTYGSPGDGPGLEAFEVFTTGIESLYAGSEYDANDPGFREFILGTLALLGRDKEPDPPAPTPEEVAARASARPVDTPTPTTPNGGRARRSGGRRQPGQP